MLEIDTLRETMTISEMAYTILAEAQSSLHYKTIFEKISEVKSVKSSSSVQSCIYAQDDFLKMGSGYWGLREWLLNGLRFIYKVDYLDYQRQTLQVGPDYRLYFPTLQQANKIKFSTKNKVYNFSNLEQQAFVLKELYAEHDIQATSNLLIEILDIKDWEYRIIDFDLSLSELDLREQNQRLADLAFEVLKKERGIMSADRLLKQLLIKLFQAEEKLDLAPLVPISEILTTDSRFSQSLSGLFTLNI